MRVNNNDLDFDNLKDIKEVDSDVVTIYAYSNSVNEEYSNYAIGFYEDDNEVTNPVIINSTSPINNISYIEYYTLEGVLFAKYEVNQNSKSISLISQVSNSSSRILGCGDATAKCIEEAYTKSGWLSVGLFIGTLVAPEIGLAVAGACAITECLL